MTAWHLVSALKEAPAPPCERFACSMRRYCAEDELACSAFAFYVSSGQSMHPNNVVQFPASGFGKPRITAGDTPRPDRETYVKLGMAADREAPADDFVAESAEDRAAQRGVEYWLYAPLEVAERSLERAARHQDDD